MESATNANKCHDCRKVIKDGFVLKYQDGEETIKVLKCKECYENNPSLEKFRKCEVYSRIVGYFRPLGQWNYGKRKEFKDRKEFKLK